MKRMKLIFIVMFLNFVLFSCKHAVEPPKNEQQWENITYNLEGQEIRNLIMHNNKLHVSTDYNIYTLNNKNWDVVINTEPSNIIDFGSQASDSFQYHLK